MDLVKSANEVSILFFSQINLFMKHLLSIVMILCFCGSLNAQYIKPPDRVGQMWNTSNTYYGTANSSTLYQQKDTAKGATIYLTVSKWTITASYTWAGPIVPLALNGTGTLAMDVATYKTAVLTPTITVTPQQSATGLSWDWAPVPGVTVATLSPTSTTTSTTVAFNITDATAQFYRLAIAATDTGCVQAYFNFKPKS